MACLLCFSPVSRYYVEKAEEEVNTEYYLQTHY
uniref:Uncharacterized protein n=1 Tax=Rhizophora mucronata TaxID=61149 RepID=A0A2P2PCQ7_RHIMU